MTETKLRWVQRERPNMPTHHPERFYSVLQIRTSYYQGRELWSDVPTIAEPLTEPRLVNKNDIESALEFYNRVTAGCSEDLFSQDDFRNDAFIRDLLTVN